MYAKCPMCNCVAEYDVDEDKVSCSCGYESSYDEYIDRMKDKVYELINDLVDRI